MTTDKETEFFKKRILELSRQADAWGCLTFSDFLTPLEQDMVLSMRGELQTNKFYMWGGSDSCIRKIAVFGAVHESPSNLPIRVLKISPKSVKFAENLTHRDFLGAIMALGIDRSVTGDIIIRAEKGEAYVFVLEKSLDFIKDGLTSIRKTSVICQECSRDVPELEIHFETIKANIASERLDLVISVIADKNRSTAKSLLSDKKVFLNGRLCENPGQKIKAGDEITVRGFGKFIYDGLEGTSKKGRSFVSVRKYS